jgi:hypothetical protein
MLRFFSAIFLRASPSWWSVRPADDLKLQERLYIVNKKYCKNRREKQNSLFLNEK